METFLLAPKHHVHESLNSVHKICPPGIQVFKCSFAGCKFWSGSRIVFDRHGHANKKRTVSVKPKCNVCSKTFFNDSSLKRHAKIH